MPNNALNRVLVKYKSMPLFMKIFMWLLVVGMIWLVGEIQKDNERHDRLTEQMIRQHQQQISHPHSKQ